jgi:hypothetical protein
VPTLTINISNELDAEKFNTIYNGDQAEGPTFSQLAAITSILLMPSLVQHLRYVVTIYFLMGLVDSPSQAYTSLQLADQCKSHQVQFELSVRWIQNFPASFVSIERESIIMANTCSTRMAMH